MGDEPIKSTQELAYIHKGYVSFSKSLKKNVRKKNREEKKKKKGEIRNIFKIN